MSDTIQTTAQLRRVNRYLRTAINQVEEAVIILAAHPLEPPGPRIYFANKAAVEITGIDENQLVGLPIGRLYEEDRVVELLNKLPLVAQQRRTFQTEKTLQVSGGRNLACRWTISSLFNLDNEPVHYVMTFRPLREQDHRGSFGGDGGMDAFLERSRMETLAMASIGVAHDFNNVLTTIQANLSLAQLATSINDRARKPIEDASAAAESAKALSKQLLAFARGGSPQKKLVDVRQLLKRATQLSLVGSNVRSDANYASGLPGSEVEETQLLQVLHNVMVNARQSMPGGGVITASCDTETIGSDTRLNLRPGNYVTITIRDRGCGISNEDMPKVFEPFYTTKSDGNGMGLATCYLIVQRHQGTITIRSKVNVGTEVKVYLPASAKELREEAEPEQPGQCIPGDGSVLVVDDQDGVRAAASSILRALGYDVISALSGEEALRLYSNRLHAGKPVSAVLMDMTLPGGMSGDDTVREIRQLDPSLRAIATSGYFDDSAKDVLLAQGYVGVLPKPYTAEKLSQALEAALSA